ncbi:hypothetical protein [Tenacibaculum singaporense]|uniref:hypothetical protein n=1 Tax=Tenacibaculum singaporense TaxID=2358479 RepID=UPI00142E820C|nr:hypothetical protein [Tenacibaculum singaporense]
MAAKTTYEVVKEVLDKPFNGHPSRKDHFEIEKLKEAILILAQDASQARQF